VSPADDFYKFVGSLASGQLQTMRTEIQAGAGAKKNDLLYNMMNGWLKTGEGTNPWCQSFAGDYPDLNWDNTRRLTTALEMLVTKIQTLIEDTWQLAFQGTYPEPGKASFFATMVWYQNFTEIAWRLNQPRDSWIE
jgi:hypothetical protein